MYQVYYSGQFGDKEAGGSNYMYDIADPELDQLILDARTSMDQSYRKTVYKSCLDIIVDWAVEIPVYQRQNAIIFSAERVNLDTVTPDITTFYPWLSEIEGIKMK
jgi:peptide/nickel transport system substrate-binding protein